MGHFTNYTLEVRNIRDKGQFEDLVEELRKREILNYALCMGSYNDKRRDAYFPDYDSVKWYEHVENMVAIAEKFPNMYFLLEGAGEEFGDFWREYYHDMDIETCTGEIIYEQPKKIQWTELIPF